MTAPAHAGGARREISGAGEEAGRARVFLYPCTELRRCGRQLDALIEGGTDHPGRSFLGPQWPANLGSVSWRWLCRLKGASCEKAGIFASAFQRVAMPQNLPFADLAVLPAGLRRRVYCGHPLDRASRTEKAQALDAAAQLVVRGRRYWLQLTPRSWNALCWMVVGLVTMVSG